MNNIGTHLRLNRKIQICQNVCSLITVYFGYSILMYNIFLDPFIILQFEIKLQYIGNWTRVYWHESV